MKIVLKSYILFTNLNSLFDGHNMFAKVRSFSKYCLIWLIIMQKSYQSLTAYLGKLFITNF